MPVFSFPSLPQKPLFPQWRGVRLVSYFCNTPSECCPFIKTFSYICRVRRFLPSDITYCESVFRKSFSENVEVFLIIRAERNNTHFRIDTCGRSRSAYPYPISIRVWGIVSSIYDQGLSTTFRKINESQLHTFFIYRLNILSELQGFCVLN